MGKDFESVHVSGNNCTLWEWLNTLSCGSSRDVSSLLIDPVVVEATTTFWTHCPAFFGLDHSEWSMSTDVVSGSLLKKRGVNGVISYSGVDEQDSVGCNEWSHII